MKERGRTGLLFFFKNKKVGEGKRQGPKSILGAVFAQPVTVEHGFFSRPSEGAGRGTLFWVEHLLLADGNIGSL